MFIPIPSDSYKCSVLSALERLDIDTKRKIYDMIMEPKTPPKKYKMSAYLSKTLSRWSSRQKVPQ